ncbi:hypothetical protein AVEN_24087-1 [Araneus ventricosus]|uniref:Uncharacterized protein n=1 Tax=Araneus ventricosus TaxID=182803 RepID=A0A4Y2MM46_ARAVE|nr:hypothetical protein AVEN_131431-1 [Araneus ventricosus]GBN28379.1 hypothetical protein AVEN_24087-1 [Araneus ventricosus]
MNLRSCRAELDADLHSKTAATLLQTKIAIWEDGDPPLDGVITGGEAWVKHANCETKWQSIQWGHMTQVLPENIGNVCKHCQQDSSIQPFFGTGRVCFWLISPFVALQQTQRGTVKLYINYDERFKTSVREN